MKKKPITVEDLWRIERVAQPTLSPDGAQACVSITKYDMEENKSQASLWLLSAFGGEPRRLTQAGEKDGEPQWSPDGRWIAFVAKRPALGDEKADEEPQVYLIAPDGGEARRLTRMPTGAFGIKWFPDSRRIAFLSWVWPGEKSLAALAKRYRAHKDAKVKAHVVEHSVYRYWDHWLSDGRVVHLHSVDVESGRIRDHFAGSRYELVRADPNAHAYDISPDGRAIVFTHDPEEEKRFDHEHELVELDVRSGRFRPLTRGSRRNHEGAVYSPDGRHIALLVQDLRATPIAPHQLAFIDRKSGRLRVAATAWDRSVHAPLAWSADSRAVIFTAEDEARQHLFRWDLGETAPRVVARGGTVAEFDVAGEALVYVRNAIGSPSAVYWSAGDEERRIDRFNDELMAGKALGEVREFRFRGHRRRAVQMWVVYPPGFDPKKRWPLMQVIHGGPHSMWGDTFHMRWNAHAFAAQGYVVACVNYHGSTSFGQAFKESIVGEFGLREMHDVEAATDFLLDQGYIDPKRLVATGGSYGGYMVAWLNGHTDRYKAYVCHAGCFDWVSMCADDVWYWFPKELGAWYWEDTEKVDSQNPRARAARMRTPTLVMHGLLDYRVPDAQGLAYFNTLKSKGVPARLVFFPDENHWILKPQNSRLWYREYFAWLARWVKTGGVRKGAARR